MILLSVLSSYVLPPVLLLLPLYLTLGLLGLINTYTGVILTHVTFTLPFCLWLLRSFFQAIPIDLEKRPWWMAALDSEHSPRLSFRWHSQASSPPVSLVSSSPGNEPVASVLLTGEARMTVPIGIAEFISQFDIRWGEVMAASTLATIPVMLLFFMIQKHFVRGLMAGAIKG